METQGHHHNKDITITRTQAATVNYCCVTEKIQELFLTTQKIHKGVRTPKTLGVNMLIVVGRSQLHISSI